MNPPSLSGYRLLCALLLGLGLGIFYGFLRPVRSRHKHLADLLFLMALYPVWIFLAFGICRGDLRFGYTLGLFAGILGWECTFGRWLRPVFLGFWRIIYRVFRFLALPFEKFFKIIAKFAKFLFATGKKWVIIKWNNRLRKARQNGGATHGRKEELLQSLSSGIPSQLPSAQMPAACYRSIVYGDAADRGRSNS